MSKDYTLATKTKSGYQVKDIVWNSAANMYLGKVADPKWARQDRPFVTASWTKSGKCVNSNRPDVDLVID